MDSFEPHQYRSALANLLASQQTLLASLNTRIQEEREALNNRQSETLFKLAADKQSLMEKLEQFLQQSKTVVEHLRKQMPTASTQDIFSLV